MNRVVISTMVIFTETKNLLKYLGYIDHTRLCGGLFNVILRAICLTNLLFLAIPSLLYICFLVESFSDGTEAAVTVIAASTNFGLFSLLLWNRMRILDLFTVIEGKMMERECFYENI